MTLEEKIKHLQNASMEEARLEGNAIVKEHSDTLEQIFQDHKEAALRQATLQIKTETNNAKQELNKAMAKAQIALKREQGACQTELKQKLFKRVGVLLQDYIASPAYKELLYKQIMEAVAFAKGEEMNIYLTPSDESLKAELEKQTGMTLRISREDFTGGIRAVLQKRNILINRSFQSALAEEYDKFLFVGGKKRG
ncbi:MAG: V-type ATP synthase subunit E [Lachnospiraceae bacterium]